MLVKKDERKTVRLAATIIPSAGLDEPTNSHKQIMSMDGTRNLLVRGLPVSVRTQLHGRQIAA